LSEPSITHPLGAMRIEEKCWRYVRSYGIQRRWMGL
jgi:hypothetical protein